MWAEWNVRQVEYWEWTEQQKASNVHGTNLLGVKLDQIPTNVMLNTYVWQYIFMEKD